MPSTPNTFIEFEKSLSQINENNFDAIAWQIFQFQAENNPVYRTYLSTLGWKADHVNSINEVPFLPIRFFKEFEIKSGSWPTQHIYKSSGTTEMTRSSHHLWDENFYLNHATKTFEKLFGSLETFHVLALLPFYDVGHSSLVAMTRHFIQRSKSNASGFFLDDPKRLTDQLFELKNSKRKTLLIGVSHALLDLIELGHFNFPELLVLETGGMKGRKKEIIRNELHNRIKHGLGTDLIYSEYGMTELLSQAYTQGGMDFQCASTMKVIIKEINDPFSLARTTGIINVIDLANFHSSSFIETQDLGRVTETGFQVLGRVDNSEARGCNLLLA